LIGEHPANGQQIHPPDHHPPDFSLEDYVRLAREGGYLGAWPWSFKGVDGFGAVSADQMRMIVQCFAPAPDNPNATSPARD